MPRTIQDLEILSGEQLHQVFAQSEHRGIPIGDIPGKMLYLADNCLPRFKVWAANLVWRGKYLGEDTMFFNRWIGNRRWLGSNYRIDASWVDGRPAIVLEYPPDTPFFANLHDEMREVAPGLWLGLAFEREPVRKFVGFFAIALPECHGDECRHEHQARQLTQETSTTAAARFEAGHRPPSHEPPRITPADYQSVPQGETRLWKSWRIQLK